MKKFHILKISSLLLVFVISLLLTNGSASASSVHIANFSGTTEASTTSKTTKYHHFYSSKDAINVKFQVEKWVKTHNKKEINVEVQKSNGFWWSTKATKKVTSTKQISIDVDSGEGDYRLVIYDTAEPTGYDKPPLYYAKSTKYSGSITGL